MKETKISFFNLLMDLINMWWEVFTKVFIFIIFLEVSYIATKISGVESFTKLALSLSLIFFKGLIIIFLITIAIWLLVKIIIPGIIKIRKKKKKEFFQELKEELKLKK